MRKPHIWGGEPELLMCSHVLQWVFCIKLSFRVYASMDRIIIYNEVCYICWTGSLLQFTWGRRIVVPSKLYQSMVKSMEKKTPSEFCTMVMDIMMYWVQEALPLLNRKTSCFLPVFCSLQVFHPFYLLVFAGGSIKRWLVRIAAYNCCC